MVDVNKDGQLDGRAVVEADFAGTSPPTFETAAHSKPPVPVTVLSAEAAYARVMAEAGTCLHRDAVESRLIGQLGSLGTKGAIIADESDVGGQPAMTQVTRPAGFDTDGDGMPDAWETAHGLDPNSASDGSGDRDGDGYTNVEEYLNAQAELACPGATTQPPDPADAGAPGPVDAAVPPVDARDAAGSGGVAGTGGTGAGGSGAGGAALTGATGGTAATAATGGQPGSGGGLGTGGPSASGGGTSPGAVGAGSGASTGGAPGIGATQAGNAGCSCGVSPVEPRSSPAWALLGFVMVARRVRKRRCKRHRRGAE
jgi:MYXO-CTERM domain-containing protein